uniref:NADH-ubiquinone oxidoreductase chain 4 n=1 Tax=Propalticus sp. PRO01 TaxID=1205574 RepID=A0A0S2MQ83_9CUCU|nr:NADH deshydrogenase subunit 4 [Propalticus sp. PRO01]
MMKILLFMLFLIPLSFFKFFLINFDFFIFNFFFYNFHIFYKFQINYISYMMGMDLLSFLMVLLSIWICSLMILASGKIYHMMNYSNLFNFMILILMISLFLTFCSLNLFIFYFFFEVSLLPTLFLIIGWGYQPERIEAGMYLLFYTLFVSLPMMISIFYLYKTFNSLDFTLFFLMNYSVNNVFIYLFMIMIFMVKFPMFFVHLWLPKAHVEAPVSGSMILAGVMLKLGGYGLLRILPLFIEIAQKMSYIFVLISMFGGMVVSLVCIRQSDMKSLIAYSSVAHMGLVLGSIMTLNSWGIWGALTMMVAHGLCSSGLFCLANINYERVHSRSLYLNKGFLNIFPSLTLWWFLFNCSNMAAPPSLNLLGEVLLMTSLINYSMLIMFFVAMISFFSAVYSLFLFSFTQHGMISMNLYSCMIIYIREYLLLFLHYIPLNLLFLKSDLLVLWV